MSISDTPVTVATTWTPSTARRRGLPFLCPCLCRVQPTDTSRRCALGGQIDHDRLPCRHVQSADTNHRCVSGAEPCILTTHPVEPDSSHSPLGSNPRTRICGKSVVASWTLADVFQSGFWTLAFGRLSLSRWTPASPCRARSQTVLLHRARCQIVLRDRALMPGTSPTRARSAKSSPRATTSAIFLHRCSGRKTLQATTPSNESCI